MTVRATQPKPTNKPFVPPANARDAYRVAVRRTDGFIANVIVTRVLVVDIYRVSKMAAIRFGRNLHSAADVPMAELHSTPERALASIRGAIPELAYARPLSTTPPTR